MVNISNFQNREKGRRFVVTSFDPNPDGSPGRAESLGKIAIKDCLVAINDVDITAMGFSEAMKEVKIAGVYTYACMYA